ncbi:MAG: acylphosphatase [Phycisphaerae bacterium]|nr:acylphosphatase [Phycisphaerae bacterium]
MTDHPAADNYRDARTRRTILFSGRVQGVGFRYTTCNVARTLPVAGYVRNLADGRVETVVEGPPDEIDRLVRRLRDTFGASIRDVHETASPATGEFRGFEIRF